jgi:hypothetical protein
MSGGENTKSVAVSSRTTVAECCMVIRSTWGRRSSNACRVNGPLIRTSTTPALLPGAGAMVAHVELLRSLVVIFV